MSQVPMVMLPNGLVVNRATVNSVYGKLLTIKTLAPYKLWEFVFVCRNPGGHKMLEATKKMFVKKGLLHHDGQPKADVQNITLYIVTGNDSKMDLLSLEKVWEIIKDADLGRDVE